MNARETKEAITVPLGDGIFLIPGRKSGGCNVFVLKGTHKVALIDVGMPDDFDYLRSALAELDLTIDDVGVVVLTHEHVDHVGGLRNLPKRIVVAAHARAANKLQLDDEFSMMGGAFDVDAPPGHVDIHLEDGSLIDLGNLRLRTVYTPGHCSGAICLYEPGRGILFSGDMIFAGGILGGIFASGNISDYINSLERLRELRLVSMYPGHGRMSTDPAVDLQRAIKGSVLLMSDTRNLFESLNAKGAFSQIKKAAIDYSRRAAERRQDIRVASMLDAVVHLNDADHPVSVLNISLAGARLDREIALAKGEIVSISIGPIGHLECELATHLNGHTRLKFFKSSSDYQQLRDWLQQRQQSKPGKR